MQNPDLFVRVSTEKGHSSMPRAIAERGGVTVLKSDAADDTGAPLPPKPRTKRARKPRARQVAATPTTTTEADAPANPDKESA